MTQTGPFRLPQGGRLIDRAYQLPFRFDGRQLRGVVGDTLASALLANGQMLMGRSFKYHRPRGPIAIDPATRDIVQTVYVRKVEKVGSEPTPAPSLLLSTLSMRVWRRRVRSVSWAEGCRISITASTWEAMSQTTRSTHSEPTRRNHSA